MNQPAINVQPLPPRAECEVAVLASRAGAGAFSLTVAALEAWLRVPVRPVLDGYLHAALSQVSSIAAAALRRPLH